IESPKKNYVFKKFDIRDDSTETYGELWNIPEKRLIAKVFGQTKKISSAQFTNDEKYLVTAAWDGSVIVRNTTDGKIYKRLAAHHNIVISALLNSSNKYLLSCSGDSTAIIWNFPMGTIVKKIRLKEPVVAATFAKNTDTAIIATRHA